MLDTLMVLSTLGILLSFQQLNKNQALGSDFTLTLKSSSQFCEPLSVFTQVRWCDGNDRIVKMASTDDDSLRTTQIPAPGFISGQRIRSPLARAVYHKIREDEENKNNRHVYWYRVIVSRFSPELQSKFIQFEQDEGTDEFLHNCTELSNQVFTQLFHSMVKPVLNLFMNPTSVNGFLNRGSMFIFSRQQIETFLKISPYQKWDNLLDLGAGDGKVTAILSPYFKNTYATEMSSPMVRRLRGQGFRVLGINEWHEEGRKYDLISCLNLLDRCDRPITLLANIRASLTESRGRLLLAVVIPFKPYVEFESSNHEPSEVVRVKGANFEEEVEQFHRVFNMAGFEVEAFTRLPYLCEGDLRHSFYVLTDAVFLLKPKDIHVGNVSS